MRNDHFDWRINLGAISAQMGAVSDFPKALQNLRFKGPLTVIVGEHSNYVRGGDASAYEPMFSDVHVEVIANAGHWVHADQPAAFIARVAQTLHATT